MGYMVAVNRCESNKYKNMSKSENRCQNEETKIENQQKQ